MAQLDDAVRAVIDAYPPGTHPPSLLGLLAAQHPDPEDPAQRRAVRDQVVAFLLAGHETTASALTWTCRALVERHNTGLSELTELVAPWTPERTEQVTGIPAASLRALVHDHLQADGQRCPAPPA